MLGCVVVELYLRTWIKSPPTSSWVLIFPSFLISSIQFSLCVALTACIITSNRTPIFNQTRKTDLQGRIPRDPLG